MSKHYCQWPECRENIPPKLWGCTKHWGMLPSGLRKWIWCTYKPKPNKFPSLSYIRAAIAVRGWIRENPDGTKHI